MSAAIERLLSRYEGGQITRRDLVISLSAMLMAGSRVMAQPRSEPIAVRTLNHVTLTVSDIPRSVEFYQRLFGLSVQSRQGTGTNLAVGSGPSFIGLFGGRSGVQPDIGHFCLGVEGFDADRVLKTLDEQGVTGRIRNRGEVKELYFTDPDNISVQLQDVSYCGGSGVLGNSCAPEP